MMYTPWIKRPGRQQDLLGDADAFSAGCALVVGDLDARQHGLGKRDAGHLMVQEARVAGVVQR